MILQFCSLPKAMVLSTTHFKMLYLIAMTENEHKMSTQSYWNYVMCATKYRPVCELIGKPFHKPSSVYRRFYKYNIYFHISDDLCWMCKHLDEHTVNLFFANLRHSVIITLTRLLCLYNIFIILLNQTEWDQPAVAGSITRNRNISSNFTLKIRANIRLPTYCKMLL